MRPSTNLALTALLGAALASPSTAKFDPYSLNGGLVSAVAGKDYVIICSDTRLTDGGYQIHCRSYLDGRLWSATGAPVFLDNAPGEVGDGNKGGERLFALDGSLVIPSKESRLPALPTSDDERTGVRPGSGRTLANPFGLTLIGSAGCASDCEELKRTVRTELTDRSSWASGMSASLSSSSSQATATTVATLLLHTLYSRRPFPYYAFCVLAGLDAESGEGQVHVYDAIGSHERVAVACAGTPGREMLQPVLDRMFASPVASGTAAEGGGDGGHPREAGNPELVRDGSALGASGQRVGSVTLRPPVGTCVGCGPDEAVALLVKAYRSVSEREIGVGDDLVICVIRRGINADANLGGSADEPGSIQVLRIPLKKH